MSSYHARLRSSALRLVHGDGTTPICCVQCGEDDLAVLELHHADHDGNEWRKIHGVGAAFYRYLLFKPEAPKPPLLILCGNCHNRITIAPGQVPTPSRGLPPTPN